MTQTHNIPLLRDAAGFIVNLQNGRVIQSGNLSDVMDTRSDIKIKSSEALQVEFEKAAEEGEQSGSGKLVMTEEVQRGQVSWSPCKLTSYIIQVVLLTLNLVKLYAIGLGGNHVILFFIVWLGLHLFNASVTALQTWYLGYWASQYENSSSSKVTVSLCVSLVLPLVILLIRSQVFGHLWYAQLSAFFAGYNHKRVTKGCF
jgi:hypothetical protein